MKTMAEDDLEAYIRKERDQAGLSFEDIAEKLRKQGYVSKRTKKAWSPVTIRQYYFHGSSKPGKRNAAAVDKGSKLSLIESTLDINANDTQKIAIIRSILAK